MQPGMVTKEMIKEETWLTEERETVGKCFLAVSLHQCSQLQKIYYNHV
jgi:hypothetical protein